MRHTRIYPIISRFLLVALLFMTWIGAKADTVTKTAQDFTAYFVNKSIQGSFNSAVDYTVDGVTMTLTPISGHAVAIDPDDRGNGQIRGYKGATVKLSVPGDGYITSMTITADGAEGGTFTASAGTLENDPTSGNYTWSNNSGNAKEVTLNIDGDNENSYVTFSHVEVTYEADLNTLASATSTGATYTFTQDAEVFANASLDGKTIKVSTQQMSFETNGATSDPMVFKSPTNASINLRMPAGSRLTIAQQDGSSNVNITKVLFTFASGNPDVSANVGTYTQSNNSWEGTAESVTFTFNEEANIQVVQTEAVEMYTITLSMQGRGTVKVDDLVLPIDDGQGNQTLEGSIKVKAGTDVDFVITPSGERFYAEQAEDNQTDIATQAQTGSYTISSIDADHTVYVRFALKFNHVTYMADGNGNISFSAKSLNENDEETSFAYPLSGEIRNLSHDVGIPYGATSLVFSMTADDGDKLGSLLVDGVEKVASAVKNGNVYTYTHPGTLTTDIMVQATFVADVPEPYAQVSEGTLTFYYDKNKGDFSYDVKEFDSAAARGWDDYKTNIQQVVFTEDFKSGYAITSMAYWFQGMESLTSIDLRGLNVSGLSYITGMFSGCQALQTIFVDNNWPTSGLSGSNVFENCNQLVGGRGTTFEETGDTGASYARIDKAPSAPGYFTGPDDESKITLTASANGAVTAEVYSPTGGGTAETYNISADSGERTKTIFVPAGYSVRLSMTPAEYYSLGKLKIASDAGTAEIEGTDYDNIPEESGSRIYTYENAVEGCVVTVEFETTKYEVALYTSAGGTINYTLDRSYGDDAPSGTVTPTFAPSLTVDHFTNLTLQFAAETDYGFSKLLAGDTDITGSVIDGSITLNNFNSDITYSAQFEEIPTVLYARLGENQSGGKILTFYYDKSFDANNTNGEWLIPSEGFSSASARGWNGVVSSILYVNISESMRNATLNSLDYWFSGISALANIDLSVLNLSNVNSMVETFRGCSSLTSLDFKTLNLSNVTNMDGMFQGCTSLATITVASGWPSTIASGTDMFTGCTSLVGGRGTTYSADHTDATYARIDKAPSAPGYLTGLETEPKLTLAASANGAVTAEVINVAGATEDTYTIAEDATERTKTVYVPSGYQVKVTMTPSASYQFSTLSKDNTQVTSGIVDGENNSKVYTFSNIDADCNVNVAFAPVTYTITYNLAGGALPEGVANPMEYTVETPNITLPTPTREGYTFGGWVTESDPNTVVSTIAQGSTGNRTYIATWLTGSNYTISYDLAGGAYAEGISNPVAYNVETETFTLNNPTREGYTFTGWTGTDLTEATTTVTIAKGSTGERSYTANWSVITYTISYDLAGGALAESATNPAAYTVESDAITLNNPTKDGYTFAGWTGTGLTEATTTVIIPTGSTENREYTATWTPISYTISYDLDGGAMAEGVTNPAAYTVESDVISLNNPTRKGYTFAGWTGTGLTEATTTVTIAKGSTGERSYTANWSVITYNISYDLAGGALAEGESNPASYTVESDDITLKNPTRTGYTFAGWTGTGLDVVTMTVTIAKGSTGDRSYTATWTENEVEPYAVLSDNNSVLTFYYDTEKESRGGMDIGPFIEHTTRGWYENIANITRVVFDTSFANVNTVTSTAVWFSGMSNLTSIEGLQHLNTQNVTNMENMFGACRSLTSLDLSSFNTQNVTNMRSMFAGCSGLTRLNLSSFETQNVTSMQYMFNGCSGLTSLDIRQFNTQNVTDMNMMFGSCSSLTSLDVSRFNTQNVTDMCAMFTGCSSLTSLDVTNFNTQNVTRMDGMFTACSGLTSLDLSSFNTQNVTNMFDMFNGCSGLITIYAGNEWSTDNVTNSGYMFNSCISLVGGRGTAYDVFHNDASYARIDMAPNAPGYFTRKDQLMGDANDDGSITIADAVATVTNILGEATSEYFSQTKADMNSDSTIDIFDVTLIVNAVLAATPAPAHNNSIAAEDILLETQANSLTMGISDSAAYTAFQFDVTLPEGTTLEGVRLTNKATNHQLTYKKVGENTYRVVGLSMTNQQLSAANGRLVQLQLSGNADERSVTMSNVLFVGQPATDATAIRNHVTDDAADRDVIYDLNGRYVGNDRQKLSKGIYIINHKKVNIK